MSETVIVGGSVWDGTGATARGATVRIRDGRIVSVADGATRNEPDDAQVVDATGKFVMPGMIDCHVHLTSSGAANYELQRLKDLIPLQALRGAANARTMLQAGFTTVRDLSAPGYANIAIRQAIEGGFTVGPRVLAAGMSLTVTGGHGDSYYRPEVSVFRENLIDGPDAARRAVRETIKMHADVIKLLVTGGVMTDGSDVGALQWTPAELSAAIEQAHQLGVRVAGHCHGAIGVKEGVKAGLDTVEHGTMLDEEAADLLAERGAYLVPTIVAGRSIVKHGTAAGIAPHVVRKAEQVGVLHQRSLELAQRAGVKIAFGTDCGTPFNRPGENAVELALLVEAGLSPIDALTAATRVAAEAIGLSAELGTLEPGKIADLLVIDGDPLHDVNILRDQSRMAWVFSGGKIVKGPPA
ncbi:MAG: amidohydrolase family protein [Candidatus Limnocylindrales bacterium]